MANDNNTNNVVTAAALNAANIAAINAANSAANSAQSSLNALNAFNGIGNGTNTSAGGLNGSEIVPASRGSGILQTTLTTIATWIINTFSGFTQAGIGAVARTALSKLQESISVKDFGAKGDGVTDDTAAIQAAINYRQLNGGGSIYFPTATYLIAGTLIITGNNIRFNGTARRASILKFANGASDCITVQGSSVASPIYGFQMDNLELAFSGKTGGRTLLLAYVNRVVIRDIDIESCYTGFEIYATNDVYLDNLIFQLVVGGAGTNFNALGPSIQKPTACYGIFWHGAADGSASAVQLTTVNVTVSCNYSGADGFIWDGNASTWNMVQTTVLNSRYGLWIKNSAAVSSNYPTFLNAVNFNTDGVSIIGVRIDGGSTFQIANSALTNTSGSSGQGSADTLALQVNPDLGNSFTREVYLTNCRVGYALQGAALINARDVILTGCTFVSASTTPSNTYPALEIGASAQDVIVTACKTEIFGATNNWKYSIQVDTSSVRISVAANELRGWTTKAIYWQNNDASSQNFGNAIGQTPTSVDPIPFMLPGSDTVVGAYTITAAKMSGGIYTASGTPGAFTATTDSALNLVANLQTASNGKGLQILVINATNGSMSIAPGSGVSLSGAVSAGNFVIAQGTSRVLVIRFNNVISGSESVTIYG